MKKLIQILTKIADFYNVIVLGILYGVVLAGVFYLLCLID